MMNAHGLTDASKVVRTATDHVEKQDLDEAWFDEAPPSTQRRSSAPPVVQVGEFLGDPVADAWLR